MKLWDIKAWNKYKNVRKQIWATLILTFITGIVIGLAISQLI